MLVDFFVIGKFILKMDDVQWDTIGYQMNINDEWSFSDYDIEVWGKGRWIGDHPKRLENFLAVNKGKIRVTGIEMVNCEIPVEPLCDQEEHEWILKDQDPYIWPEHAESSDANHMVG